MTCNSETKATDIMIRIAIIGCGAVTQNRYLPSAKLVPDMEVSYLVDTNLELAKSVAEQFEIPKWSKSYADILGEVDAVVINTPPKYHAEIAINCMENGVHVLSEKPMAVSLKEAAEMVKTSRDTNTHLAVGMNRRLCSSSQLAYDLLINNLLGRISKIEAEEGYEFGWPLNSMHLFKRNEAGGGVLMGTGPHLLDLLFWLVSSDVKVNKYEHDDLGGLEANANINLSLKHNNHEIPCRIKLSLTRNLANKMIIYADKGILHIPTLGAETVSLFTSSNPGRRIELRSNDARIGGRIAEFSEQIHRFVCSIKTGKIEYVAGAEALETIKCIEQCYQMARTSTGLWEKQHAGSLTVNCSGNRKNKPTVFITGSTGFVGSRLAEHLVKNSLANVCALANRLSSPGIARLARLPVDIAQGNVLNLDKMLTLTKNCDAIVHCAYGSKEVTVQGTRNILEAARRNRVGRIIHLSTSVVHGKNPNINTIDETAPFVHDGDPYCESKIEAENAVWKYHESYGLPVVVLRPTCVYGPYGRMWTIRPINEIKSGAISLVDESVNNIANVVYIDNLVDAIILALSNEKAHGEAFLVADDDQITWNELYQLYSNMFSGSSLPSQMSLKEIRKIKRDEIYNEFLKTVTFPYGVCRAIALSPEVIERFRDQIWFRFLAGKLPEKLKEGIKGFLKREEDPIIFMGNSSSTAHASDILPDSGLIQLYSSKAICSNSKLKRCLNWRQGVSLENAMVMTKKWLLYQRLI